MRRGLITVVGVAALGVTAGLAGWAPAGGQTEGQLPSYSFEIIKDVHGDGPTSGFVIDYECRNSGGSVEASGSLNFDNLDATGHETQVVEFYVDGPADCSIVETDSNGADLVEYECEFFIGSTAPTDGGEGVPPGCTSDQSAHFSNFGDFGSFLVRNTFEPEVLPDDDEPPVADPDVVTATPPFTG